MASILEIRQQLVDAAHRLHAKGLVGEGAASLSMRVPGQQQMVVAPRGSAFAALKVEEVELLAFDAASDAERSLHAMVYRTRSDTGSIAHLHPQWASALRLLDRPMPAIFDEQVRQLGRSLKRLPYSEPALGREAIALLKDHDNAFLYGDGVLCLGVTRDRVIFNAELLEKCAKAYVLASATGRKVGTVPLFVREIAHSRMLKDQKKAAAAYARGEVPTGFTAY
jgi:ribulose-5-phosphate 4-epimerase/fuculose-1-phosphate aldolase